MRPKAERAIERLRVFIAVGFGSGLAPVAPGTFGTAAAVIAFLPFARLAQHEPMLWIVCCVGFTAIAVWAAEAAERQYRRHDVGNIVCDEFVGFFVAMTAIPVSWKTLVVGFVVFRFLDIVKIPPAKQIDRKMPGGWGVVLDDVVSGIYANVVLQAAVRLLPDVFRT